MNNVFCIICNFVNLFKMVSMKDAYLLDCETYEDYLNSYITARDLKYLNSVYFSRMLVELGYSSHTDLLKKDQFELKKKALKVYLYSSEQNSILFSEGLKLTDPVFIALAAREKPNNQKIFLTIIFLKYITKTGFDITGYIDYEDSLRKAKLKGEDTVDWRGVFTGRKTLRPQSTDLSYHDWRSGITQYNDSGNFKVIYYSKGCLSFMCNIDRKYVRLFGIDDPIIKVTPRTTVYSEKYGYVMFHDHLVRKKN